MILQFYKVFLLLQLTLQCNCIKQHLCQQHLNTCERCVVILRKQGCLAFFRVLDKVCVFHGGAVLAGEGLLSYCESHERV